MLPKTTGQTIASNLHACQIISGRDVERVAKQIDAAQDPVIKALENAEERMTAMGWSHVESYPANQAAIKAVRLALFAALTGADHALITDGIEDVKVKLAALSA